MNNIEDSAIRRIIIFKNIVKDYGSVLALNNISLSLEEGMEHIIMGPSGSGKTTILNLIAGLDTPSAGEIIVDGKSLSNLKKEELSEFRREKIGIVFQQFHLIPYLNALENVMLAQYFHSMPDKNDAILALELVGLKERAKHLPSELSGGEQQRVAIARAITNNPKIILADEPTGNLDEENERIVLSIFKQLKDEGKTLVMVTHNQQIASIGDNIIRLEHGKIRESSKGVNLEIPAELY